MTWSFWREASALTNGYTCHPESVRYGRFVDTETLALLCERLACRVEVRCSFEFDRAPGSVAAVGKPPAGDVADHGGTTDPEGRGDVSHEVAGEVSASSSSISAGLSRRWACLAAAEEEEFEYRPTSSIGLVRGRREASLTALGRPALRRRSTCDPCGSRVSRLSRGFESCPLRSTWSNPRLDSHTRRRQFFGIRQPSAFIASSVPACS